MADPKECRQRAAHFDALAVVTTDERLKQQLRRIAREFRDLAVAYESEEKGIGGPLH